MMHKICSLVLVLSVYMISNGNGERTKDKMYEKIDTSFACFRRMNATHQTGCTSDRTGSTGVIHFIEHEYDIDFLLKNGNAGRYVPVLPTEYFTRDIVHLLKKSDLIAGIILYKKNTTLRQFSNEAVCPNQQSGLSDTCQVQWNKEGTALLHEDYPFPIFLVKDDDSVQLMKLCYEKFNKKDFEMQSHRSLCSLELSSFMFAARDTQTCIRRSKREEEFSLNPVKFCDPLGDKNIWSSLYPVQNKTIPADMKKKYIILAARQDATSLFNEDYPGARSPLTGMISLLTIAALLKNIMPQDDTFETNILFVLFNGESYDYIGSQRLVYDMYNDVFPVKTEMHHKNPMPLIRLKDIHLFVELSQLSATDTVYIHRKVDRPEVKSFVEKLKRHSKNYTPGQDFPFVLEETDSKVLPPASLQTFTKEDPDFPGLVLTDHFAEYVNLFYNSIYDDAANIKYRYYNVSEENPVTAIPDDSIQFYIAKVAQTVAYSLYEEITNRNYTGPEVNQLQLVDELFNCYLLNANCKIHGAVFKAISRFPSDTPFSLYVGVTVSMNMITDLTALTLAWLTGDTVDNKTATDCKAYPAEDPVYSYYMMSKNRNFIDLNETECVRTTMNFTSAYSPAFIIEDYDWMSGKYSSWSESSWRELGVRMYLKPSSRHEIATLVTGTTIMVLSMIVIYFVKSRAHILFAIPAESSPTSC